MDWVSTDEFLRLRKTCKEEPEVPDLVLRFPENWELQDYQLIVSFRKQPAKPQPTKETRYHEGLIFRVSSCTFVTLVVDGL